MGIASLFGGIASLGHPPFDLTILTFLGLIAAFAMYGLTTTARDAALVGWAFGAGFFVTTLHWIIEPFMVDIARHGWLAPFAMFFLCGGLAIMYAIAFGVARWLSPNRLVLVMTLTVTEVLRAYLFTGFPWAMQSYAWVDSILGQSAAWIGPHGLNTLIFMMAALLSFRQSKFSIPFWGSTAGLVAVCAITLWPAPKGPMADASAPVVRLIQPNAEQHLKWDPAMMPVFYNRQLDFTSADNPVDLVVWPEIAVPFWLHEAGRPLEQISQAARGATVVLGIQRTENQRFYNTLIAANSDGHIMGQYDKGHLVPFGEFMPAASFLAQFGIYGLAANQDGGFAHGSGPGLVDLGPLGLAMPLICYEGIFPHLVNGAPNRADFLLMITNDAWFGKFSGPYQHLAQARMRAIEQGLPMVRVANTGVSAMIDARGHIIDHIPLGQAGYLDVALPPKLTRTLYNRTGDLPLFLVLCLALAALAATKWRKSD
ncbi:apolipoprotein N-acyltransferase [Sulfitobacter sp. 1151]|uniref:Apolipoprotein N-acyltransferase n=2 Tax=Parasulfitobacter algicola TaxID=2614809 RepID=A0ABX2ISM8_9RHOB|nr:apolipoprotein N-acyltransferase [Sulfitobacter algicola]NSX55919.1 apolipoprotein N-acyltransferase [Sulfitobacter algicola]